MTLPSIPPPPFIFEKVKHAYVLENPCLCRTADIRYPFLLLQLRICFNYLITSFSIKSTKRRGKKENEHPHCSLPYRLKVFV